MAGLSADRRARRTSSGCATRSTPRPRRAGRDPADVELLAAVKYVAVEDLGALLEAGLTLLGENRAQELEAKAAAWPERCAGTSSASSRAARSSTSSRSSS